MRLPLAVGAAYLRRRKAILASMPGSNYFLSDKYPGVFADWDIGRAAYADAGVTLAPIGGTVRRLGDVSGNNRYIEQLTDSQKAVRQNYIAGDGTIIPVVLLDGFDDYYTGTLGLLAQPTTLYTVIYWSTSVASTGYIQDGIDGVNRNAIFWTKNDNMIHTYAGTELIGNLAAQPNGVVLTAIFNGASSKIYANGTLLATGATGSGSISEITFGARYNLTAPFQGMFARAIVYSGDHDVAGYTTAAVAALRSQYKV